MMQFDIEWEEAPGMRDSVLAATWGRLALRVDGTFVTELLDVRSSSRRTAVYGSLFPLAEWVVENWWNLLHEPSPASPVVSARAASAWMRPYMQRHGLLSARDGGALPDLTIWRDEAEIILHWAPDPPSTKAGRVRFVSQGHVRLPPQSVQDALSALVNQVLDRLDSIGLQAAEDTVRLRTAWAAIQDSTVCEPETCRRLAVLGLNPYDPDEVTDEVFAAVERASTVLPPRLADDLLEGTRPADLVADLAWVEAGQQEMGAGVASGGAPVGRTAHETGYAAARAARQRLGLDARSPIGDLPAALISGLGWSDDFERERWRPLGSRMDGVVGWSLKTQQPLCVVPPSRSDAARRFLLARAVYLIVSGAATSGPRLLSAAATRQQRASRAFAAEFLVPAQGLVDRAKGAVSESVVDNIADEYRVSPLVVKYQIENHMLGTSEV